MPFLVVMDSEGERRIELGDRLVIGRDRASDVVIDDPMVSLKHAEVVRAGNGFEINDLGSRHGTYVRESRIKSTALADGDEILLGVHRLRFEAGRREQPGDSGGLQFDDVTPPFQTRIAVQRTRFRPAAELSESEIRADYEKLRAAFEIASAAGGEREVRPLLERILHSAVSVMGAERTAAVLVDPRDGTPFLRLSVNMNTRDEPVSLSTKLLAEVMRRREGVMVGGPQVGASGRSESMAAQRIRTAICAPLLYRDQVLGVIYVDSRITGRRFEEKDLEVLVALANQAAGSLKAALSVDEVERVRSHERERTVQVLRHLPDGVVLLDGERRIVFANLVGGELLEVLEVDRDQPLPERVGGISIDDLSDGRFHRFDLRRRPRRILEAAAIPTDDGLGLLLVLRDVTADRVREEQTERQERLAILGRLVAGVAHDLNNVLTVIMTCADGVRESDDLAEVREYAVDIVDSGKRASRLNRQLLVFSTSSSGKVETVDAAEVVEDVGKLWGRLLADRIRIEIRCAVRPAPVRIDRAHLEQAILNLVVNARDAARPGGSLVLEVREAPITGGRGIEILAIDDGVGMAPEIAERIFEPFFTTKGDAGTGLGLATVHRVVRSAGGSIDVRSQPGEGSTFRILLPRAAATASRVRAESMPLAVIRTGTVLLVEDHEAVREAAARTLRGAGHQVLSASTAEEALEMVQDSGSAVDVLVADLVLPGMTGLDLAAEVRRRHPAVHVVYMSGYLDEGTSARVAREGALFLAKPFGGKALLAQVGAGGDGGES